MINLMSKKKHQVNFNNTLFINKIKKTDRFVFMKKVIIFKIFAPYTQLLICGLIHLYLIKIR